MLKRACLSFLILPLALAACADNKEPMKKCPQVAILRELDMLHDYARERAVPENLVAVGHMKAITGQCAYDDDKAQVSFKVSIQAQKGPRLGGGKVGLPYFVSIVSPENEIISKQLFTAQMDLSSGNGPVDLTEDLDVAIPLQKGESAEGYRVLTGFQLTAEQLQVERAGANSKN